MSEAILRRCWRTSQGETEGGCPWPGYRWPCRRSGWDLRKWWLVTRALRQIQARADAAGDIDWLVQIDSTIVRAHQPAAATGRKGVSSGLTHGAMRPLARTGEVAVELPRCQPPRHRVVEVALDDRLLSLPSVVAASPATSRAHVYSATAS